MNGVQSPTIEFLISLHGEDAGDNFTMFFMSGFVA